MITDTLDIMQIMERRKSLSTEAFNLQKEYDTRMKQIRSEVAELDRLEKLFCDDTNIHFIQIAESVLYCHGDVTARVDGRILTEAAALDIATGCKHLRDKYFGNKRYSAYYQSTDCNYGYGPSHGSIVDEIGLKNPSKELTDTEKQACIYYLKNYSKIHQAKAATA